MSYYVGRVFNTSRGITGPFSTEPPGNIFTDRLTTRLVGVGSRNYDWRSAFSDKQNAINTAKKVRGLVPTYGGKMAVFEDDLPVPVWVEGGEEGGGGGEEEGGEDEGPLAVRPRRRREGSRI